MKKIFLFSALFTAAVTNGQQALVGKSLRITPAPSYRASVNRSILQIDTATGKVYRTSSSGGSLSLAAIGSSTNANGATISGTTLNLEPATTSFGGVVTTGTQTFAGTKTFNNDTYVGQYAIVGVGGTWTSVRFGSGAGSSSMRNNCVAIGVSSMPNNSSGFGGNTSVGWVSGWGITSGYNNLSFGDGAGYGITSGHDNTAIGVGAMGTGFISVGTTGITGNYNVAVGYNALYYNKGSNGNIAIGYNALGGSSLASVNGNNIGIGPGSGSAITTGSYNVILGGYSGSGIATQSKWIVLSDGYGNDRIYIDSAGNTGIGITSPSCPLDVNGTGYFYHGGVKEDTFHVDMSAGDYTMIYPGIYNISDASGGNKLNFPNPVLWIGHTITIWNSPSGDQIVDQNAPENATGNVFSVISGTRGYIFKSSTNTNGIRWVCVSRYDGIVD